MLMALFTPLAMKAFDYTVCDGSSTNAYVPLSGITSGYTKFEIPGNYLTEMADDWIYSMTFYVSTSTPESWSADVTVYMKEIEDYIELSELEFTDGDVVSYAVYCDGSTMHIDLNQSFDYHGGTLAIGMYVNDGNEVENVAFYGVEFEEWELYAYYFNATTGEEMEIFFLPKITFELEVIPYDCPTPSHLTINYTQGETTAEVSWDVFDKNTGGNGNTYVFPQFESDFNTRASSATGYFYVDVNGNTTRTSDNPYTIQGIQPATNYTVSVQTECGDDASGWATTSFFSGGSNTPLWSEDFEGGTMPTGWTTDGPGTWTVGTGDYHTSTGAGQGVYNALITHGSTGDVTKLITPAIDLSSVSTAELSFMHIQRSWSGDVDQLRVYYRASSSGTWTQLVAYTAAVASWTTESEIVLPNLSSTYQLAFEFTDKYGYGLGIDDIVIERGASCIKPINFAGTASSQSVTLTWESDAPQWAVAYSTNPTADPSENVVTTVSSPTYTMNNLAINEDHYFWVRANCSATDQSAWEGPLHIGYCLPAPTSVDNDGISNVTFGTGDDMVNNSIHPTSAPFYSDFTSQIGAVQAGVESQIAITYATNYTYNTYVWVDLNNDWAFTADEVVCYGESIKEDPTTLTLNFIIPATQTIGDYRLRIGGADSGLGSDPDNANPCYSDTYGIFEDYTLRVLEAPSCMPASDVTVEDITTTSAVIRWTNYNGDDATYTVMQGETVLTTTAVDSYTLSITHSTSYPVGTFTIISDCDETMIANVPAFASECDHITTLPWSEDFENFANNTMPMCWDNSASTSLANGTSNDYYIWGVYTYNDNNMLQMCNYWAQVGTALINSPMIELPADVVYQLSFDYAHTATCGAFHVNISEDNGVTWVELGSYSNEGGSTSYTDPGTFIPVEPIFLTDYAGKTVMLQFYADANYGQGAIFVDNISITEAPSCLAPQALAATATAHSAELSWTARNGETEWTVYYKKSTDASYTEESGVTENPYTLDVEPSSIYEFYVVANCNADDASEPSDVYTFRTECEAFTITEDAPYTQNFEDPVVTSTWESSTGLEIPVCWENPYTTSTAQAGKPHLIAAGASYNYSDSQVLYFYGSGDNYVTLPEFDNELNNLTISFKWATESDTYGTLTLGYITAEDEDYNTFTEIKSFDACSDSYRQMKEETVRLNDVSWDATRLAFRWSYTGQWSCNIDDLEVFQLPTFYIAIDPYPVVQGRYDLGYYLIASPLADNVNPMSLGMITDEYGEDVTPENSTYDLYFFDQTEEMEWRNYRYEQFELVNGKGYLYASKDGVELHFTGKPYKGDGVIPLDYAWDAPKFMGWNLIGNPFPYEAIIDRTNYVLDIEGQYLVARGEGSEVPAMSGVFVQADDEDEFATFTVTNKSRGAEQSTIARTDIVVSDNKGKVLDNAIVRFDSGQTLGKFSLRANSTKIYVPFEGKNYAIVNAGQTGEMPINFVAKNSGTYALSFSNVGVDFSYLHLVDNLTGNDVDLLANPSYSFEAKTTDYSSRFKLVYAVKDGPSTGSGTFAFVNNGDIIVNGEGTLQVIDVMGRIIVSRDGAHTVSTNGMTPGVYMLRLVNGNDVKTQKVVIE